MAAGFRVASATWTEITTDLATVAIPATPQAGDRMWLLVSWKDFARSIVGVAGAGGQTWTAAGAAVADGTVASSNGAGSMRVQAFYRDWVSGDVAPAIDWDATTSLLARAAILVLTKAAGEDWSAPLLNTAAWPVTATTQTVSASATTVVPNNSAVLAFIGLRDDSATFTRAATTGIDVASGITWNGNYAEQPPTHHTTVTGADGAGDAGYRLVTTGGTVTLRVTATISAVETGSVAWITQGVQPAAQAVGELALLDAGSAIYAPAVGFTAMLGLLDAGSALYAPTLSAPPQSVGALGLIDAGAATFAPAVGLTARLDLIDAGAAVYAPSLSIGVALGLIDAGSATYAPSPQHVISLPLIDAGPATYAPALGFTATLGLIDAASATYAPALGFTAALPLVDAGPALYAPSVGFTVALGLLDAVSATYAPSVAFTATLPLVDAAGAVYALSVAQVASLGLIDAGAATYALAASALVHLGLIDAAAAIYTPSVSTSVALGVIDAGGTIYAVTVSTGGPAGPQSVSLPLVDGGTLIFDVVVSHQGRTVFMSARRGATLPVGATASGQSRRAAPAATLEQRRRGVGVPT